MSRGYISEKSGNIGIRKLILSDRITTILSNEDAITKSNSA